jgi:putative acetyltransferase
MSGANVMIRDEVASDRAMIRRLNEAAFGGIVEADLVDALRVEGAVLLSCVADRNGEVVGHVLFSRMWIDTPNDEIAAVALAPMAVLPEYQRQGIGTSLIPHGLDALRSRSEQVVIVVGHPSYYPRFGFSVSLTRSLESPFPPDAFMALELRPRALDGVGGRVRYPRAFMLNDQRGDNEICGYELTQSPIDTQGQRAQHLRTSEIGAWSRITVKGE